MSKARLVITAVIVEGRSPTEVARTYNVARSWVYTLVNRYRAEGDAAFEPRSRRPTTRPNATADSTRRLILELRHELTRDGFDAGADTIVWHLATKHHIRISRATVYRIVRDAGAITPAPQKRPKASYVRFEADQPNETWQSDFTHHRLADGTDTEIITWLDDHSRYALSVTCHQPVTGPVVVATFTAAIETHGIPASTLTDNGLVYTTRFAQGGRTSRNGFENLLVRLGVHQKNSRPNHPTTCGKVERFQQTMKRWLRTQPAAHSLTELQAQLDTFADLYNHHRPHRGLAHHSTPATAYTSRPKAGPTRRDDPEFRVRRDVIRDGNVTLRVNGELHHIGLGRTLDRTPVIMLITGHHVRVIHAQTGEIIRQLTINPERRYHGTGQPRGGPRRPYGPRKTRHPEP